MEPKGWFVKDFADGWIFFDNEEDASRQVQATGAVMLVGIASYDMPQINDPISTTRLPTIEEQRQQGQRCGCHGTDDYCVCQNTLQAVKWMRSDGSEIQINNPPPAPRAEP